MKLDLLYEFQPKIKPWAKPHPYGQREAEQRTYDEAIAEIQYADTLGFNTVWCVEHHFRDGRSASPCSRGDPRRARAEHEADQARLRRDADAVRLHPPGARRREGRDRRRAEPRSGRVGHRPLDADGAGRVRRARRRPLAASTGARRSRSSSGMWEQRDVLVGQREPARSPSACRRPSRSRIRTRRCGRPRRRSKSAISAGELGLGLLSFALLQPVETMAEHIQAYRDAQAMARPEDMLTRVRNDRVGVYTLVHAYDDADEAADYGLWESVNWWYQHLAEFTLQWELPKLSEEEQKAVFPLLEPVIDGDVPVSALPGTGHDHHRHPRGVPREDPPLRRGRRRPAALLRAVRRPSRTRRSCATSSCSATQGDPGARSPRAPRRRHRSEV